MMTFNTGSLLWAFLALGSAHALDKYVPQSMAVRIFAQAAYGLHEDAPFLYGRCHEMLTYGPILPPRIPFRVGEQRYYLDVKASMELAQVLLAYQATRRP